jgi:uncharacterized protein (DUF924 family)
MSDLRVAADAPAEAQAVLDFWFLPAGDAGHGFPRPQWFRKDVDFDDGIRARFGALHEHAASGGLEEWGAAPRSMLALIVVLDQFSRNLCRDDPRAFASDARALRCANLVIDREWDLVLKPVERQFCYLPFEHSERLEDQDRAVALFGDLGRYPETRDLAIWAEKHRAIVKRFGRFPHRNIALGRQSTPEEIAFLAGPDSRF